jgi:predicted RNA-binding Zn ribbon-like protein
MIPDTPHARSAKFLAGRLCLDFVNTKSGRGTPTERDRLGNYDDLLAWCMRARVLNDGEAADLERQASRDASAAEDALQRARRLRDALHGVFVNIAHGRSVPDSDLAIMNGVLADAARHGGIAERDGVFGWQWHRDSIDCMLWPIAHSAAGLLTGDRLVRIGECGGVACGWLFLDETRNRSRRWCEMEVCGNRAKARRHYHRHHAAPTGG